jgi:hypothetical protein
MGAGPGISRWPAAIEQPSDFSSVFDFDAVGRIVSPVIAIVQ